MEDKINELSKITHYDTKLKQINILQKELNNEKNEIDKINDIFNNINFIIEEDNKYKNYSIDCLNEKFIEEKNIMEKIQIYKVMTCKIKSLQKKLFNK